MINNHIGKLWLSLTILTLCEVSREVNTIKFAIIVDARNNLCQ